MVFVSIVSNEKISPNWIRLETHLLICSLFTLLPNATLFKELNINKDSYSKLVSEEIFVMDSEYLGNFFLLVNKPLVRQLAYNILQPIFQEITNVPNSTLSKKNDSFEQQALEKYIRKFKYFYKLFFSDKFWLSKYQLTEKEINSLAIKFLFILIGI